MKMKNISKIFFCFILFIFLVGCSQQSGKQPIPASEEKQTSPETVQVVEQELPSSSNAVVVVDTSAPKSNAEEKVVTNTPVQSSSTFKEITIEMQNWDISMSPATLKKGDTVKLMVKVKNGRHGLSMPAFDVKTGELGAGEEEAITFVADKAGSFDYFCYVPCGQGHKDMRGKLVVEE